MPRFPLPAFALGALLVLTGALLLAALLTSHLEVTLRLAGLAPALLCILSGSIVAVLSVAAFRWERAARLRGARGTGFVDEVERSQLAGLPAWRVRVRFRSASGRELRFRTGRLRQKPRASPGEKVAVWVLPENPLRYHFIDLESEPHSAP